MARNGKRGEYLGNEVVIRLSVWRRARQLKDARVILGRFLASLDIACRRAYQKLIRTRAACATRWGNPSPSRWWCLSAGLINLSLPDDVPLIRLGVYYRYPNTQMEAVFAPPPSGDRARHSPAWDNLTGTANRLLPFPIYRFFSVSREKTVVLLLDSFVVVPSFQLYVFGEIILTFYLSSSSLLVC